MTTQVTKKKNKGYVKQIFSGWIRYDTTLCNLSLFQKLILRIIFQLFLTVFFLTLPGCCKPRTITFDRGPDFVYEYVYMRLFAWNE